MPELGLAELMTWVVTAAVYLATPVAAVMFLRRIHRAGRTRR